MTTFQTLTFPEVLFQPFLLFYLRMSNLAEAKPGLKSFIAGDDEKLNQTAGTRLQKLKPPLAESIRMLGRESLAFQRKS